MSEHIFETDVSEDGTITVYVTRDMGIKDVKPERCIEVVRCRDCRMADLAVDVWCELFEAGVTPDHFCSFGRRREDA